VSHPSRDDLTGYVLGALELGEDTAVAEHANECERCTAELRQLAPAVGVLAESVEQHTPPPELRERLMSTVRSEASQVAEPLPAPRSTGTALGRFRRRGSSLRGLLLRPAAGLAALAIVAAAVGGYLIADKDSAAPATTVALESPMPSAGGSVMVDADGATLQVHGMPRLAKGAVYQVWVARGPVVRPSASFVPHEDGTATAAIPEASADVDQVLVTREPHAGVRAPTLPPVLTADLN
jgi:anti-sigma factor RsiW